MPVIKPGKIHEADVRMERNFLIVVSYANIRGPILMTTIVEGVYKQGKIELLQIPHDLPEGRVQVIVISQEQQKPPLRLITFGMYPGDTSTLEDFKDAEWHGEAEWGDGHGQ